MVHLMEACLLTALQAYLLGSLLFGVLVSKLFYHDDVRLHGSGNAGMTNVLRTYGKLPAVITTIGDVAKVWLPSSWGSLSLIRCCPAPG